MPTKPQSNLPPQAQPWGRYVEESLANLERGTSINGQNSNNNLRQLNSSVQLLSQQQQDLQTQQNTLTAQQATLASQQAYLSGLKTYTSSNNSVFTVYTVNTTVDITSISNTFTLDRTSTILINFSAWSNLGVNGYGGAQGYFYGSLSGLPGYGMSSAYQGGGLYIDNHGGDIVRPQYIATSHGVQAATLAAGTYTATVTWKTLMFASWNASCQLSNQRLTISVIS